MTKNMDVPKLLRELAAVRAVLPQATNKKVADRHDGRTDWDLLPDTIDDFEQLVLIESIESLAGELQAAIEEKRAALVSQGLEIYYATEELVRSGEHPHLAEKLEEMRRAWERDYGTPIPKRGERAG
jgi:hypothetical protein